MIKADFRKCNYYRQWNYLQGSKALKLFDVANAHGPKPQVYKIKEITINY